MVQYYTQSNQSGPKIPSTDGHVGDRQLRVFLEHFGYFGCNIVPPVSLWWWMVQGGYFGYKIGSLPYKKAINIQIHPHLRKCNLFNLYTFNFHGENEAMHSHGSSSRLQPSPTTHWVLKKTSSSSCSLPHFLLHPYPWPSFSNYIFHL